MTRHLKPGSMAFTLLLGSSLGLQLLAISITLPVLPSITAAFNTTPEATQLSISAFLAGIGLSQLLHGALTDRFGRKPVLLGGLTLYMLAGIGCALAPGIQWLIGLRALQGIGSAAGMVVARAMVRDLFEGSVAVRMISRLALINATVPIVAPLFGGWLLPFTGWRGVYAVLAAASVIVIAASATLLAESIRQRNPDATNPRRLLANCWRFVSTPGCLAFAAMIFCANGAMYGYLTTSAFVLMTVFGVSSANYGWFLAITGIVLVLGATASARIARIWSIRKTLGVVTLMGLLSGLLALAGALIATHANIRGAAGLALMMVPMLLYSLTVSTVLANATTAALHPVPEISGVASAMVGSVQMLGAGFFVWLGGWLFDGTPATMGYGSAIGGAGSFLIFWLFGRRHAPDKT